MSQWASGITSSDPNPKYSSIADGVPGGRVCQVDGFGHIDEQLVRYEPATRTFAYTAAAEKIPSFADDLTNTWTISADGPRAEVQMVLTAEVTGPIGAVMKPMMRRRFDKVLAAVGDDLRHYVETGRVSTRKASELAAA